MWVLLPHRVATEAIGVWADFGGVNVVDFIKAVATLHSGKQSGDPVFHPPVTAHLRTNGKV
jgi:hypothetical protein